MYPQYTNLKPIKIINNPDHKDLSKETVHKFPSYTPSVREYSRYPPNSHVRKYSRYLPNMTHCFDETCVICNRDVQNKVKSKSKQ